MIMEQIEKKYTFANECPLNEKKTDYFVKFLDYCFKVLALEESKPIDVHFIEDREDDPDMVTTAYYNDSESKMSISTYNRAFIDIARSTAHELTHKKQFSLDPNLVTDKHSEGKIEDQANAVAGKIIRGFGEKYPEAYDEEEMEESINSLKETLQKLTNKEVVFVESNEERGYIDYAYDLKTKQLKREGSGVASEYSIGMDLLFYYNKDQVKKALEQNGILKFRESPYMSEEEIKQELEQYISKFR